MDISYGVRMGLSSLRPWFLEYLGLRNFPPLPGLLKRGPIVAAPLAAAVEPLVNQSLGVPCVVPEAFAVADHTVVIPTALQLALARAAGRVKLPSRLIVGVQNQNSLTKAQFKEWLTQKKDSAGIEVI